MTYIIANSDGTIASARNIPYEGAVLVDYEVAQVGGRLYKAGTEPAGPTENDLLLSRLRGACEMRLAATDKYVMPDYPISAEKMEEVKAYRAAIRALNRQPGAPWDGGGDETPWPEQPTV